MTSKTTTLDFKARSTADPKPAQQAANEQPCAVDAQSERLHRIVVVGGGAGGLELVTRLGDTLGKERKAEVTLIEKARTHLWKPLLHEVAAGSMDLDEHALDYLAQAHWHHFRYRYGEMVGLDRANRRVLLAATYDDEGRPITPERSFAYDTLVIAVGSRSNDFGTPGVKEHAIALDTPEQAARFNRNLVNACLRAHTQAEPVRPGQLHVAIIGAGATGTELSAELHRTIREVVAYGLDRIDPGKDIKITLIEAADRILPALPPRLSDATTRLLQGMGVDVRTNARVTEVRADGVQLADGDWVPSDLVVWAAGVRGPDVLAESGRARSQPQQPTHRHAYPADHPGREHPGHWRLRLSAFRRTDKAAPAAGAGGASTGLPCPQADPAAAQGRGPEALRLSRSWIARFLGQVQHGRQLDGFYRREEHVRRGAVRAPDVSLALQDA